MLDLQSFKGFTPGPWAVHLVDETLVYQPKSGEPVAQMDGDYQTTSADMASNAALIAAAPDLLSLAIKQEAEIKRLREALEQIASYHDKGASERLAVTGSYSSFDEPGSVEIAREALESPHYA